VALHIRVLYREIDTREDRLGGSGREDVFTDDPDYVTFPTDGIEPAESAQLPGVLTSHKHNGERNSTFFYLEQVGTK
jgi:hypothetical protein